MENQNKIVIGRAASGEDKAKEIGEFSETEAKNHKILGSAHGINLGHCVYLAHRHCQDFVSRAIGYRIIEHDHIAQLCVKELGGKYILVEFYEE